jgi:hypothetical protein
MKNDWSFLFPVKAMSQIFRGKFLQALKKLVNDKLVIPSPSVNMSGLFNLLYKKDWVVYAKAPFGGPQAVIEYLGRYTHKVAISNHRISGIDDRNDTVSFDYKDYADDNKQKQMTLNGQEFIRRFEQHILPKGFTKIRTYGYLSNRNRHTRINEILKKMKLPTHKERVSIPLQVLMVEKYCIDIFECPRCKCKTMQVVQVYYPWKHHDDG